MSAHLARANLKQRDYLLKAGSIRHYLVSSVSGEHCILGPCLLQNTAPTLLPMLIGNEMLNRLQEHTIHGALQA